MISAQTLIAQRAALDSYTTSTLLCEEFALAASVRVISVLVSRMVCEGKEAIHFLRVFRTSFKRRSVCMQTSPSKDGLAAQELECTICGSVMIDPRVLQCQHVFCLRCVYSCIHRDRSLHPVIKCPFGCPEVTSLPGDVRTLKRNPIIASLCANVRRRTFTKASGNVLPCDWCSSDNSVCSICDRCNSFLCSECRNNCNGSDHTFLCVEATTHAQKQNAVSHATRSGADSAALSQGNVAMHGVQNEASSIQVFEALITPVEAARRAKTQLELLLAGGKLRNVKNVRSSDFRIDAPKAVWLPHYQATCVYRPPPGRDGSPVSDMYCSVVVPPLPLRKSPSQRSEEELLWDSKELSLLACCTSSLELMAQSLGVISKSADRMRKAMKVACSVTDLSFAALLCSQYKQTLDIVEFVIVPSAKRLALYANFYGFKFAERHCQLFAQVTSAAAKKRFTKRIRAHLELSVHLISQLSVALSQAVAATHRQRHTVATLEQAIGDIYPRAVSQDTACIGRHRVSTLCDVGSVLEDHRQLIQTVCQHCGDLQHALTNEQPDATRGVNLPESARETYKRLEAVLLEESEKLLGVCGSTQHLQVLWMQCSIVLGKTHERNHVQKLFGQEFGRFSVGQNGAPLELDQGVVDAAKLIASIAPQVDNIRQQHIALLRRNPNNLHHFQVLQGQLCTLTAQVLDLFQKEHYLTARVLVQSSTGYLLGFASALLHSFHASQEPEDLKQVLGSATLPSFSEPISADLSACLSKLGSYLNLECAKMPEGPLLSHIKALGRGAAVVLQANIRKPATMRPLQMDFGTPLPEESKSRLFSETPFDDDCRAFALAQARRCFASDLSVNNKQAAMLQIDLDAGNPSGGSTLRHLLPYYHGHFYLPLRSPGRVFEYLVDAQNGDITVESIPRSTWEWCFDVVNEALQKTTVFVGMQIACSAAFALLRSRGH